MEAIKCPKCCEGWICECHPDKGWPHDDCPGPGRPCEEPGCEMSLFGMTPGPEAMEKFVRQIEESGGKVICRRED